MNEIMEYGKYAPYIGATYSVSIIVIAAMIVARQRKLKKALEAERMSKKQS